MSDDSYHGTVVSLNLHLTARPADDSYGSEPVSISFFPFDRVEKVCGAAFANGYLAGNRVLLFLLTRALLARVVCFRDFAAAIDAITMLDPGLGSRFTAARPSEQGAIAGECRRQIIRRGHGRNRRNAHAIR